MFCMRRNYPLSDFAKRAGIYLAPVAAGIVYLAVFRYSIIMSMMDFPGRTVRGMGTNFLTQMKIIVTYYLPRILFPIRLNYDPQISAVESFLSLACLVPIAVIGLLLFIAFRTFKTRPEISFGLLWYFITISPTTSFFSLLDLAAERRVYLPLVGVSLVIGSFIDRVMMARTTIPRKTRIATLALAAVLLAFLTFQRNLDYANPAALWYKSAVMSPKKMRPLCNYVHTLIKQGKDKEALQAMKSGYNGVSPIRRNIEDGYSLEFMVGFMIRTTSM